MLDSPTVIALLLTILTSVAGLTWWLSMRFSELRHMVYEQIEKTEKILLDKIEYHERHDDKRFSDISNALWEIRLRNAAIEGLTHIKKERDES